jgi:hypothetical protein
VLKKTNYADWSSIMKVKLQARQMLGTVRYGNIDRHEDRPVLEALLVAVPPEMAPVLADKPTPKEAWVAIAKARIGSDRAPLSRSFGRSGDRLAFRPGEDIDEFILRLCSLM